MEELTSSKTRGIHRHSMQSFQEDPRSVIHLHAYDEIPKHLKDNPYITSGYCCYLSARDCLRSMFVISNELFNIWTHLGMSLIWIPIALYDQIIQIPHHSGGADDHYVYLTYVLCVTACMTASAGYHTFIGHVSEDTHYKWHRFDICGIIIGMLGCYIPGLYYGFWCHSKTRNLYMSALAFMIMASAAIITRVKYLSESWRLIRLTHLSSLVAFGIIPALHWTVISKTEEVRVFLPYIINLYLILGAAFFIYVTKIPERILPGKFDVIGSSHNIWHILTAYSFLYWRRAAMDLMAYRYLNMCSLD